MNMRHGRGVLARLDRFILSSFTKRERLGRLAAVEATGRGAHINKSFHMIGITRAIVRSCGQQESRRIFVIGLKSAGKSALVNKIRIQSHEFAIVPLRPTVG